MTLDFTISFFQVITLLVSFIGAWLTLRNANKTVRFQRSQVIVDLLSRLISVVDPSKTGWDILIAKKYVSDEHLLLENKLLLWLDDNDEYEAKLIEHIKLLREQCTTIDELNYLRNEIIQVARVVTTKKLK